MLFNIIQKYNLIEKNPLSFRYEITEKFIRENYWAKDKSGDLSVHKEIKKHYIDSNTITEIVNLIKVQPGKVIEEKDMEKGQSIYTKKIDDFLVSITIDATKTHHIAFTDTSYKYIPWKIIRDLFINRRPFIINDKSIIESDFPENINKESNLTRKQLKDLGFYLMSINQEFIIQGRQIKDNKSRNLMILKLLNDDIIFLELEMGTVQIEYISK